MYLRDYNYLNNQRCLFAFNIWNIDSAMAVMDAAASEKQNVILQTSTNIYERLKPVPIREFITTYSNKLGIKTWLHLDHCKNMELLFDAVDSGWDSVMFDGSALLLNENVKLTNKAAEYAHSKNVLLEAEIGQFHVTEEDICVLNEQIARREDINYFSKNTDVDMIAVAFGNAHGQYKAPPILHYDLVEYTTNKINVPFVVHGGTGMSQDSITRLMSINGVKKINVSTEVKLAYRQGIINAENGGLLQENKFQAINVEDKIHDAIVSLVCSKLKMCRW